MKKLAAIYPEILIVQQAVAQIPWGHIRLKVYRVLKNLKGNLPN